MIGALEYAMRPLRRLRLRTKLTLVALAVTLASSMTFAVTSYLTVQAIDRKKVLLQLDEIANSSVLRLSGVLDLLEADAFTMSRLPELEALLAAGPGSAPDALKTRLERAFTDMMSVRRSYAQVRLIGRNGNWTELARVNRRESGFEAVAKDALQPKGDEAYLAGIEAMQPGESYYHGVTLNRENGQVEGPPMLRLVRPIFDAVGAPVAALVINADFEKLLQWALPHVPQDTRIVVVNADRDGMVFDLSGAAPHLQFHSTADWQPPPYPAPVERKPDAPEVGRFSILHDGIAVSHLPLDVIRDEESPNPLIVPDHGSAPGLAQTTRAHLPFQIRLLAEMPEDKVSAAAREGLSRNIVTALMLAVMTILLALALGTRVLSPLTRLTEAIRNTSNRKNPIVLEEYSEDEVGELATELTVLSNKLLRETQRLDNILMTAADAIVTIDAAGRIVDANRASVAMFGYPMDELVGQPISTIMFDEDATAHQSFVDAADEGACPHRMAVGRRLEGRRKDGSAVAVEISVGCSKIDGRRHFTGIIRDVSEARQAQQRQADLMAELERSNSELDQFAYVASHDLKAPLRVIQNASRWLEEDLSEHFDDDTRESMALLRSRVDRMERLLDDLLMHSRIGRVAQPSTLVTGEELIAEIQALAGDPGSFTLEMARSLTSVVVQRMPLQTVLLNLVTNAIKHHDKAHATVRIGVEDTGEAHIFTVEDDGPGIPPQYHKKVFDLFQTLQPRDRVDSSGMGLAMVRKHVEVVGGGIELISDGSRGTTVRLRWPKATSAVTEHAA